MEVFEIKKEVNQIYESIKDSFNIENTNNEIKILEEKMQVEGFWESKENLDVIQELNVKKSHINDVNKIQELYSNIEVLIEFIELGDEHSQKELEENFNEFLELSKEYNNKILLNGKYDINNAIVTINAGAGGTEACDWANMLFRMYERWTQKKGFKMSVLDMLAGDETGIKSITFNVKGEYAYGYLSCEKGVHRLVRISPFDSNARRHTSFVAVNVTPEIEKDVDIKLDMSDISVDTYRASGAGGQHVNTTDSAVRLTHIPTGIVVTCQNERSQIQNRETALKILKSKLFELELKRREQEIQDIKGVENKIEWGSQIRSYVMQPYKLVKDHRTKFEEANVEKVMNGDIDDFITSYLKTKI